MIVRIASISREEGHVVRVCFDDGRVVLYDVAQDIADIPAFGPLQTEPGLFEQMQLDSSRTCVYWNDVIDLASDSIYEYGVEVTPAM